MVASMGWQCGLFLTRLMLLNLNISSVVKRRIVVMGPKPAAVKFYSLSIVLFSKDRASLADKALNAFRNYQAGGRGGPVPVAAVCALHCQSVGVDLL